MKICILGCHLHINDGLICDSEYESLDMIIFVDANIYLLVLCANERLHWTLATNLDNNSYVDL